MEVEGKIKLTKFEAEEILKHFVFEFYEEKKDEYYSYKGVKPDY